MDRLEIVKDFTTPEMLSFEDESGDSSVTMLRLTKARLRSGSVICRDFWFAWRPTAEAFATCSMKLVGVVGNSTFAIQWSPCQRWSSGVKERM